MSNAAKVAVPLLLLAAAAGGVAYWLQQERPAPPVVAPTPAPQTPAPQDPPPTPVVPAKTDLTNLPPVREQSRDTGNAHADADQGVRGRVLLPNGKPAAGVPVFLLENMMNNMAQAFLLQKTGQAPPPLASTQTADDGTFALGVRKLGKAVDLRIAPDSYPERSLQQIKVLEADWYDTHDIVLEEGLTVSGRVVEMHSKAGIANATVFLQNSQQSFSLAATPGRERGTPAVTDQYGAFRFTNAPRMGLVNFVAEATGYATGQLQNYMLKADAANEVTIEVETGQPLAGVVVDGEGKPLASVNVQAQGHSAKTPQTAAVTTDTDGHFTFSSLRPGPYKLIASSPRHAEATVPLAMTGEGEVKIVMSMRGTVRLKVLAANEQALKTYKISLKRCFPAQPGQIANMMDWADRQINPSDYREFGDFAAVHGLPTGDFCFQITENNHAKSLSPQFSVVEGGPIVEVVAKLTLGGTITGTVIDDRGQPVADAMVSTDMNGGFIMDTPLGDIFGSLMPQKHTKTTGKTDAQGRFRIGKLAFAEYMIRASHPNYCEGTAVNIKLEGEGQVVDAGVIQLSLGAVVEGVTMIGGQPTGQIKVTVSLPMTAETMPTAERGKPQMPTRPLFNATVQSDSAGQFRLLKRVPPGTYKATAQRPVVGDQIFGSLKDIKDSEREVIIAPGQDVVRITFDLPMN